MKSFIYGLRIIDSISKPLKVFCDNSFVVFLAKNNKSKSRRKHIDIEYLAIIISQSILYSYLSIFRSLALTRYE